MINYLNIIQLQKKINYLSRIPNLKKTRVIYIGVHAYETRRFSIKGKERANSMLILTLHSSSRYVLYPENV